MPSNINTKTCKTTGALYSYKNVVTANAKGARSVVAADFNGDGFPDLATASFKDHTVSVFRNLGSKLIPFSWYLKKQQTAGCCTLS